MAINNEQVIGLTTSGDGESSSSSNEATSDEDPTSWATKPFNRCLTPALATAHLARSFAVGAAFCTTKAGIRISELGMFKPKLVLKVKEAWTANLTGPNPRFPVVANPGRNVWYYCRTRVGGVRADSWKLYVFSPCSHSPPLTVDFLHTVKPKVEYPLFVGFAYLGVVHARGFTGLAASYVIGFIGDSVSR